MLHHDLLQTLDLAGQQNGFDRILPLSGPVTHFAGFAGLLLAQVGRVLPPLGGSGVLIQELLKPVLLFVAKIQFSPHSLSSEQTKNHHLFILLTLLAVVRRLRVII